MDAFRDKDIELERNPEIAISFEAPTMKNVDSITRAYSICFDLDNKELNLGIIYISADGYAAVHGMNYEYSAQSYRTKKLAEIFSERLATQDSYNIALFYEPLELVEWDKIEN